VDLYSTDDPGQLSGGQVADIVIGSIGSIAGLALVVGAILFLIRKGKICAGKKLQM